MIPNMNGFVNRLLKYLEKKVIYKSRVSYKPQSTPETKAKRNAHTRAHAQTHKHRKRLSYKHYAYCQILSYKTMYIFVYV